MQPAEEFDATVAALMDRLYAAERVCVLVGVTGHAQDTDRGKALHELWSYWHATYGRQLAPRVTDEEITLLAAQRDRTRAATMTKLRSAYPDLIRRKEEDGDHA